MNDERYNLARCTPTGIIAKVDLHEEPRDTKDNEGQHGVRLDLRHLPDSERPEKHVLNVNSTVEF